MLASEAVCFCYNSFVVSLSILTLAPAVFLAGVLMFLAPCTLPLVPGYLAFIAGDKNRVMQNALGFVLGFSLVFILLGAFAGFIGALLGAWRPVIAQAAGVLVILFGLMLLGFSIPSLQREWHARLPTWISVGRPESSFLIGALFAFGWSPCIGPLLGTVLLLASISTTALSGALLLAVFSLGLAVPFLLTALLLERAAGVLVRWGRGASVLSAVGGLVLVALGVLMLLGDMGYLATWGYGLLSGLGYDRLLNYL
jgi:cytochrome c-type biogenesis protein